MSMDNAAQQLHYEYAFFYLRSALTKQAENESVDLFMMNLYRLLLTPPIRGKNVLGLDPGFSHGCKLAVLGSTGALTKTCCNLISQSMNNSSSLNKEKHGYDFVWTYKVYN